MQPLFKLKLEFAQGVPASLPAVDLVLEILVPWQLYDGEMQGTAFMKPLNGM